MDAAASHIWQSTICAAAAGALAWMLRNNSASARYWIWFAAALKFLIPFAAISAVANRIPLPQSPPVASGALEAASLVFRSSTIPAMSGIASAFVVAIWVLGAFLVLVRAAWHWSRLAVHTRQSPPVYDGIVYDTLRRLERAEGISTPTAIVASRHVD